MFKGIALFGATSLCFAARAFGAFSLTSGNATFSSSGTPFLQDSTLSTADFRPEGGTTTDHLFYYNWSYRAPGGGNRGFSWLDTPVQSINPAGDTLTLTYANAGPGVAGQNRFNATLTIKLTDGANPGEARVDSTMVFQASPNNAAATSWEVFHGTDFDVNGSAGGDTYTTNGAVVSGTASDVVTLYYQGLGANAWEVSPSATLRGKLTGGGIGNLTNATTPLTGDEAVGYQWSTGALAPGAAVTFQSSFYIPEPASLGLLGVAGTVLLRRSRA